MSTLFLNLVVADLISLYYGTRYLFISKDDIQKRMNALDARNNGDDYNSLMSEIDISFLAMRFITRSSILLTIVFIVIYYLQQLPQETPPIILDLISTGIHIPIILAISGFFLASQIKSLPITVKKKALFIVTIAINIDFILFNWKLALFVLSIIIGKYVWIDFVYDWKEVLHTFNDFLKSKKTSDILIKRFAENSILLFYLFSISSILASNILHMDSYNLRIFLYYLYFLTYVSYILFLLNWKKFLRKQRIRKD